MNSVNSKTIGVTNKISNTAGINYMPIKLTEMEKHNNLMLVQVKFDIIIHLKTFVEKQFCVVYEEVFPPGSSVYGILQARILQRISVPFSREYS